MRADGGRRGVPEPAGKTAATQPGTDPRFEKALSEAASRYALTLRAHVWQSFALSIRAGMANTPARIQMCAHFSTSDGSQVVSAGTKATVSVATAHQRMNGRSIPKVRL